MNTEKQNFVMKLSEITSGYALYGGGDLFSWKFTMSGQPNYSQTITTTK